jgi:hypothetical protein
MEELRDHLDDIVWSNVPDPYARALDVYCSVWWSRQHALGAVRDWAMEQSEEYQRRCVAMSKKCDLGDPGVRVIYDHYYNIKDRYWRVHVAVAFGPVGQY